MKYGLQLAGKVRVFSKTKEIVGHNKKKYSITDVWFNVSEKEEDGSFFNRSVNLVFKSGTAKPENNTVIELIARPMITGNGDYRKIAYFVETWQPEQPESDGTFAITDEDLPFNV